MLGKSLQLCCSRLKRPPSQSTPLSSKNTHHVPPDSSATATASCSAAAVIYKSFNSLYDPTNSDAETPTGSTSQTLTLSSFATTADDGEESSSSSDESSPDLATAIASRRFFAATPGKSNSIVDSAAVAVGGAGAGVAVPTYSPDPYWDFRRSMEEMVAALGLDPRTHRAHLHELLLCYLALNRKTAHKYIVGAFADILAAAAAATDVDVA